MLVPYSNLRAVKGIGLPEIIGQRAVVIGAGIAGLAAARALSDSFAKVVILEREARKPPVSRKNRQSRAMGALGPAAVLGD